MDNKITELTPEQEALFPAYLEKFRNIGLSTTPTNRQKAEEALTKAYAYLSKTDPNLCVPNPEIIWAESPMAGAVLAAQHAKGDLNVTDSEVQDQAWRASYGSFEAYWVSTYSFICNELPVEKDELIDIVMEIINECGVYWTYKDLVILTPKPTFIGMKDGKLHNSKGLALAYPDGNGIYAVNGSRKNSLIEATLEQRASNLAGSSVEE